MGSCSGGETLLGVSGLNLGSRRVNLCCVSMNYGRRLVNLGIRSAGWKQQRGVGESCL